MRKFLFLVSSSILWCSNIGWGLTAQSVLELQERLHANHQIYLYAVADLHEKSKGGELNETEIDDYVSWIEELRDRISQDCLSLGLDATQSATDDLPCPGFSDHDPAPIGVDVTIENTNTENTKSVVDELYRALGEFDEQLLREQERIKAQTPRNEPTLHSQTDGEDNAENKGDEGDFDYAFEDGEESRHADDGSVASTNGGIEDQPSVNRPATEGNHDQSTVSSIPDDIPDGRDDDVVARQLREAAEKESDPELKQKLWEEYRRYKAGTG